MKKYIIYLIALLVLALPANAQQNTGQGVKTAKQEQAKQVQEKREQFQAEIQTRQEEFKQELDAKRVELKNRIETQKQTLKDRLAKIKDERKQQVVEKINDQINALNERMANHYSATLEKLENILNRISARADKAEANGRDISSVTTAIAAAQAAINNSREAIKIQAVKTYSFAINADATLRVDVGKARQELNNDLAKIRETVKSAQQAVKNASVTLAQIPKINKLEVESQ